MVDLSSAGLVEFYRVRGVCACHVGVYDDAVLKGLDYILAEAGKRGIKVGRLDQGIIVFS